MGVIKRIKKPITHKGKKFLEAREPALVEDNKLTIFIRGRNASDVVITCMKDLHNLKKPDGIMLGDKHDMLPFENITRVEGFCRKYNAPLFMFASSNKKRPNNLVLGRCYNHQLLDMIELGIDKFTSLKDFPNEKISSGLKPCIIFSGELFENDPTLNRLKNLLIDMFQREVVEGVRLQGLEHVIMFTAAEDQIYLRSYRVLLKKARADTPRVELEEIGPSVDFKLRRSKLATDDLFKQACKKPKELKVKKIKNIKKNVFGTVEGRIHIPRQNLSTLQTRKMKGLRKTNVEKRKENKLKKKAAPPATVKA